MTLETSVPFIREWKERGANGDWKFKFFSEKGAVDRFTHSHVALKSSQSILATL
jgi:hypothetical protein